MKRAVYQKLFYLFFLLLLAAAMSCGQSRGSSLKEDFVNPPDKYKPQPLWFINGELTTEGIRRQMKDAREKAGFTGVSPLPRVDVKPSFLSDAYFDRYRDILETARQLDMQVILYDDAGFPSGMAGGKMETLYPEHTRKRLDMVEKRVLGRMRFSDSLPGGLLMSAVAMNTETRERVDLRPFVKGITLEWPAPSGMWKVMYFVLVPEGTHKQYRQTDYLDPVAVECLFSLTYDEFARQFGSYFGNTIEMLFFDDIGFWRYPRGWTTAFNEKFEQLYGFDPAPYYPALWYDIGPDTEAVRHAFFRTRAELLAEGFPKLVAEWAKRHGLKDTGHPPGNYGPTPVDMNGDIFKFYRYTAVPLMDSIIRYGYGQNGFKLISSAADYYDRPLVAVEIYGAFNEREFDTPMLYRNMMDLFTRGVNVVIPHAMWNDTRPGKRRIPPLISTDSKKIAADLPAYSEFVGRASLLLRGGRRVADIGVLYPFEELAGWYRFEDPDNPRQGRFISPVTDYQDISGLLTRELRRDFTFIHPEFFLEDKYALQNGRIRLENKEIVQDYRTLILTGCRVISHETLAKVKAFYQQGGLVISTTQLPFKSTTMGADQKVVSLVKEIFGLDPTERQTQQGIHTQTNGKGGRSVFVPEPERLALAEALDRYLPNPDVKIVVNQDLPDGPAHVSYIHKVKGKDDIFYFANSTDVPITADIVLRGHLDLEVWDPHTGRQHQLTESRQIQNDGRLLTQFQLDIPPVKSVFIIGSRKTEEGQGQ